LKNNISNKLAQFPGYMFLRIPYPLKVLLALWVFPLVGLPLGLLYFSVLFVWNYGVAISWCSKGRLKAAASEKTTPPEPAFKSYFFKRGREDIYDIFFTAFRLSLKNLNKIERTIDSYDKGAFFGFTSVSVSLVISEFILGTIIPCLIILILHHLLMYGIFLLTLLIAPFILLGERTDRAFRRLTYACPRCKRKISLLYYVCSNCRKVHKNLTPDSYGLLHRKCECQRLLPTFDLAGRSRLDKLCPFCQYQIASDASRVLHIGFVGGISSGKTTFMMALVSEFMKLDNQSSMRVTFPYKSDENSYRQWEQSWKRGIKPDKTEYGKYLMGMVLRFTLTNGNRYDLYLYDVPGEIYATREAMSGDRFLEIADVLFFVVDPFSLPMVCQEFTEQTVKAASPSLESADKILQRLVDCATMRQKDSPSWKNKQVQVVITKGDLLDKLLSSGADLKDWLIKHGMAGFDQRLRLNFNRIDYFLVSAMGNVKPPFQPVNVLGPLAKPLETFDINDANRISLKNRLRSQRMGASLGVAATVLSLTAVILAVVAMFALISRLLG
jgi:hypothetical protein